MLLSVVLMCACVLVIIRSIVCYNKDSVSASCPLQHAYFGVVTEVIQRRAARFTMNRYGRYESVTNVTPTRLVHSLCKKKLVKIDDDV